MMPASEGDNLNSLLANAVKADIAEYDAAPAMEPKVLSVLLGMGGEAEEIELNNAWVDFVNRKRRNPCSYEQFVAVGHSDGATAIFRLGTTGLFTQGVLEPAYLGLVDLVREDYTMNKVNDIPYHRIQFVNRPRDTYIASYVQPNGALILGFIYVPWMGNVIANADKSLQSKEDYHFSIWHNALIQADIVNDARAKYKAKAKADWTRMGKQKWRRGPKEYW
jgi:hypothetical protein